MMPAEAARADIGLVTKLKHTHDNTSKARALQINCENIERLIEITTLKTAGIPPPARISNPGCDETIITVNITPFVPTVHNA